MVIGLLKFINKWNKKLIGVGDDIPHKDDFIKNDIDSLVEICAASKSAVRAL